jgi:hypothetical protein
MSGEAEETFNEQLRADFWGEPGPSRVVTDWDL